MSIFITFEGGEGSGKSTQAKMLQRKLDKLAIPVLLTHEPGGTPFGQRIARWLKWGRSTQMSGITELLLFNASRSQLVTEVLRPALQSGKIVICDRHTDSTLAYQSYGRGLDAELVRTVNNAATQGLYPDLTILMDIPIEVGFNRKGNQKPDRFEQESLAFHRKVRKGYQELAKGEPKRWLVIDATQTKEKVSRLIWERVNQLLPK